MIMQRLVTLLTILCAFATAAHATNTGFVPINDLGPGLYLGQYQGGLYVGGTNTMPVAHAADGVNHAAAIVPREINGNPSPAGKFALISIGMSNTTQEWCNGTNSAPPTSWSFMGKAAASSAVNHSTLAIVNGAASGKSAAFWD